MDGMSPLDVVVRILNNQLSSLMWIDEKVSNLRNISMYFIFIVLMILVLVSKTGQIDSKI